MLDFGCGAHLTAPKSIAGLTTTRIGLDISVEAEPGIFGMGSLEELDVLLAQLPIGVDCITSLACLNRPTPWAKPVLEFLSYRLNLVDESQIRDHKVYRTVLRSNELRLRQAGRWLTIHASSSG